MEKRNFRDIERYNNKKCPRCKGTLFFDLIVDNTDSTIVWSVATRCCGSDFWELKEDWGLDDGT